VGARRADGKKLVADASQQHWLPVRMAEERRARCKLVGRHASSEIRTGKIPVVPCHPCLRIEEIRRSY
jgi:hypothetical protein